MNSYEVLGRFIVNILVYLLWTCGIGAVCLLGADDDDDYVEIFFVVAWIVGVFVYGIGALI